MSPLLFLCAAILAPATAGALTLLVPRRALGVRVAIALLGPVAAVGLIAAYICGHGVDGGALVAPWMPSLQLNLQLNPDRLGLFFALMVSTIGVLITLYARGYFGPDRDSLYRFYPSLHLFMTAMIGVVLADNFVLLLLFWEMTSISSFLLIGWERDDPKAVKLAMQAFVVTGAGGLAMTGGLILLGVHTGCWTFTDLTAHGVPADGLSTAAFVLVYAGIAAKSAQFPLHFWLPGAMAAPTPVSAFLHSATMVKAGVYLTGRLWPALADALPLWPQLIVPVGALTMVFGAFVALQKTDLKKIFAYTTVSQLGLLMTMYGLAAFRYGSHGDGHGGQAAEANLIWDVTQILNHALYKAPLFILAGAIGHVASRELPQLVGFFHRGRTQRIMAVVLLLAAYGLAAGPLTVSFTAKEFFFYQIWHAYEATHSPWFYALIAAGVATGMFNVAIFVRLARTLLSKGAPPQPDAHDAHGHGGHHDEHHETGVWPAFLWIPGAVIVAFQFIGGAIPGAYDAMFGWLEPSRIYFEHFPMAWDAFAHPGVPLYMSLAAITLGVALGFSPLLGKPFADPLDHAYPGFYLLATKGGGRVFGLLQTGSARWYVGLVSAAVVAMFAWTIGFDLDTFSRQWPTGNLWDMDNPSELTWGMLLTIMVCLTALLMPFVTDRASRVLVLGACGFSVTGVFYLYKAPDLALTQISIEIVSLVLFLLVLSLLPNERPKVRLYTVPRVGLSALVGGVMFWVTLTSSVGPQQPLNYLGRSYANLGDFFLRNSHHGEDAAAHGGHGSRHGTPDPDALTRGGGGKNVVNVILVDFRGVDTMGEITVLGLAAMGVWTLLRRRHGFKSPKERIDEELRAKKRLGTLNVDLGAPMSDAASRGAHDHHLPTEGALT